MQNIAEVARDSLNDLVRFAFAVLCISSRGPSVDAKALAELFSNNSDWMPFHYDRSLPVSYDVWGVKKKVHEHCVRTRGPGQCCGQSGQSEAVWAEVATAYFSSANSEIFCSRSEDVRVLHLKALQRQNGPEGLNRLAASCLHLLAMYRTRP